MLKWFRIEHRQDASHVWIGDDIGFVGNAEELIAELGSPSKVELVIDSSGGSVLAAFEVATALRGLDATATITNRCCSAAVTLALAARRIRIFDTGRMMVHRSVAAVFGDHQQIADALNQTRSVDTQYQAELATRCRLPSDRIASEWLNGSDKWFTAAEALEAGLVDEIIPTPPAEEIEFIRTGRSGPGPTDSEKLFREILSHLPPVETHDHKQLLSDLRLWVTRNIRELAS